MHTHTCTHAYIQTNIHKYKQTDTYIHTYIHVSTLIYVCLTCLHRMSTYTHLSRGLPTFTKNVTRVSCSLGSRRMAMLFARLAPRPIQSEATPGWLRKTLHGGNDGSSTAIQELLRNKQCCKKHASRQLQMKYNFSSPRLECPEHSACWLVSNCDESSAWPGTSCYSYDIIYTYI